MPTVFTHPAVALGLSPFFRGALPGKRWIAVGALLTVLPDFDTIGFRLGIEYGDLLGHRGLTHSLFFAAAVALALAALVKQKRAALFLYLFLCMASHGLLDAFTDGGLGVAFFAPVDDTRYFFPWRPIEVSPIGLRAGTGGAAQRTAVGRGALPAAVLLWPRGGPPTCRGWKMMMATILLFVLVTLTVLAAAFVLQQRRARVLARQREQDAREIQEQVDLVMARLDAMAKLLEDDALGADEMMAAFEIIAADLAAHDPEGLHAPVVEANRKFFLEHLAGREVK